MHLQTYYNMVRVFYNLYYEINERRITMSRKEIAKEIIGAIALLIEGIILTSIILSL